MIRVDLSIIKFLYPATRMKIIKYQYPILCRIASEQSHFAKIISFLVNKECSRGKNMFNPFKLSKLVDIVVLKNLPSCSKRD